LRLPSLKTKNGAIRFAEPNDGLPVAEKGIQDGPLVLTVRIQAYHAVIASTKSILAWRHVRIWHGAQR
jgi:hypothetical protein